MELRINHQFPQVGASSRNAEFNFHNTQPMIQIDRRAAELEIEPSRAKIHIDQSQCFADEGLRSPARFAAYRASEGQATAMQTIANIASKGDQLSKIKGASIADIAETVLNRQLVFDVKAIPQQPPEITAEIYPVRFNYQPVQINISFRPGELQSNFQPAVVEIYENQKAFLEITWVGSNYDNMA